MKARFSDIWKYVTATVISLILLSAMVLMFGSTISNQANRTSDSPIYYRASANCG